MKTALIIYSSITGNTEKVAQAICLGLEEAGMQVTMKTPQTAASENYFSYDLICACSPSIQWHPSKQMDEFLRAKLEGHRKEGRIKPCAPKIVNKSALVVVTYSGPHTGLNEAIPAGKYMAQFFEHIGFKIIDEWYILCEFHGNLENSTKGKMGEIRGKPTIDDLLKIKQAAKRIAAND